MGKNTYNVSRRRHGFYCLDNNITYLQIHQSKKIKRAEFVSDLLKTLRANAEISKIEYLLDYDIKWYNEMFHGSSLEPYIDNFLSHLNYICFLKSKNLLSKSEFEIFEYELDRSVNNRDCVCYLWNIYHWSNRNKKKCSFAFLVNYLKSKMPKEELSSFESINPKGGQYIKYLNF